MPTFEMTVKDARGRDRQKFVDTTSAADAMESVLRTGGKVMKVTELAAPPPPKLASALTVEEFRKTVASAIVRGGLLLILVQLGIVIAVSLALGYLRAH